jgi:hypothetical protein
MSTRYPLDEIGINAAYKEQQFRYSAREYRFYRALTTNQKPPATCSLEVSLLLKKAKGLLKKVHHGAFLPHPHGARYTATGSGQT